MRKNFLLLIAAFIIGVPATAQKLSPSATNLLLRSNIHKGFNVQSVNPTEQTTETIIRFSDETAVSKIKELGGKIHCVYSNNRLTASVPLSALRDLAALPAISYIQVANEAKMLMDAARADAGANQAQSEENSFGAYTGKDVVVGIIDNGFEFDHIDFYKSDGSELRIKRVWDQNAMGNSPEGFYYGTEYSSPAEILAARYDMTSTFHGTHVTGIAAGADLVSQYYGVAPDADLVLVSYRGLVSNVTDGVKYIFDYAESVGKPCVINVSLGSHYGPHDGTSDSDQIFDNLTGPGRIIVGAAGNEGALRLHASKTFSAEDNQLKTMVGLSANGSQKISQIDIWGSVDSKFSVKCIVVNALKGQIIYESKEIASENDESVDEYFTSQSRVTGYVTMATITDPDNHRPNALVRCVITQIPSNYKIGLVITGEDGKEVHLWDTFNGEFTNGNLAGWTDGDTDYTVGEIGGTANSVISVGSYNTKLEYKSLNGYTSSLSPNEMGNVHAISTFSSHGPTLDGRIKPDVAAPGAAVVSASSKYQDGFTQNWSTVIARTYDKNNNPYYYEINAGTSMASPYVAGTVALWLQANPSLTPEKVRDIIRQSARRDAFTGAATTTPDNVWGAGKIDSFEGLKLAIKSTGIEMADTEERLFRVVTDRADGKVRIYFANNNPAVATIYNSLGQTAAVFPDLKNGENLDISALPQGVYILRMQQGNESHTVKITR